VRAFFSRFRWVIFGVVLILALIPLILSKIKPAPVNNLPINYSPANGISPTPNADLCSKFPKVQGEISCEEAKTIALAKYPGEIINIEAKNEEIPKPVGMPPKLETTQKEVWLLTINLKDPISIPADQRNRQPFLPEKVNTIEVLIDKIKGEFLFYKIKIPKK